MAFWIAGATLAVGAYSANQAGKSASRGNAAADKAAQVQQEQLDFAKSQYNDWKELYGGLEQNLSDFYTNLTPDYVESQGLQKQQQQYQKQQQELTQYFGQMGIESGVQADVMAQGAFNNARAKAQISADAEFKVADQKANFLNLGLGSKGSSIDRVQNAGSNLATSLTNQANQNYNQAQQGYNAAGDLLGQGLKQIVTANSGTSKVK